VRLHALLAVYRVRREKNGGRRVRETDSDRESERQRKKARESFCSLRLQKIRAVRRPRAFSQNLRKDKHVATLVFSARHYNSNPLRWPRGSKHMSLKNILCFYFECFK